MNKLKLEALISSILIYLIIIITIFSIALYNPTTPKAKKFTEKKSEVIEVSLGSTLSKSSTKIKKRKNKVKPKKKKPKKKTLKKIIKKVRNIKPKITKKPAKTKKTVKKVKKVITNKPNANSLFKNISKIKDDVAENKPIGKAGKSHKKVNKNSGIENKYFAKIQNTLKGWPAQSNFVGEVVKVELTVYSTGLFDYKILSRSLNPEFNKSLKTYLEQLKKFGFGPHSNPKPYKIIVEFIAKN